MVDCRKHLQQPGSSGTKAKQVLATSPEASASTATLVKADTLWEMGDANTLQAKHIVRIKGLEKLLGLDPNGCLRDGGQQNQKL